MLKKMNKNKKGFTLAELLVVVGIIAVLVAIAIPTFSAATDRAQYAVELANARSTYGEAKISVISSADGETLATDFSRTYDGIKYTVTKDSNDNYTVKLEEGKQLSSVVFKPDGTYTENSQN